MKQEPKVVLNSEALALLNNLGINLESIRPKSLPKTLNKIRKVVSKQIKATEYVLKIHNTCRLCKTKSTKTFAMRQNTDNPAILISGNIDQFSIGLSIENQYREVATCSHCSVWLMSLEKEKLVKMILDRRTKWKNG